MHIQERVSVMVLKGENYVSMASLGVSGWGTIHAWDIGDDTQHSLSHFRHLCHQTSTGG